jgi:hypothetical protein
MARTVIRGQQVLDGDFASEAEMEERFNQHNTDTLHLPTAVPGTDDNKFLEFNGTDYIWSTVSSSGPALPSQTGNDGKYLRTDGINTYWDAVQTTDPNELLPTPLNGNQILKSNDDGEWVIVDADDPVDGLTVIALPYYWDETRQKYLDNQLTRVVFYENGNDRRRRYLNYIPEIRSDDIPFRIYDNESYCLVNAEYHTEDLESGQVMEVRDVADNENVLATVNLGATDTNNFFIDNVDITLTAGMDIAVYVMDTRLDNPTLVLGLRKIWTP